MIPAGIFIKLVILVILLLLKYNVAVCPNVIVCCGGVRLQFGGSAGKTVTVAEHVLGTVHALLLPLTVKL